MRVPLSAALSSLRRKPESSLFNLFLIPVPASDHDPGFAGVTEFACLAGASHTWVFGISGDLLWKMEV
jgi:hypothetical protein